MMLSFQEFLALKGTTLKENEEVIRQGKFNMLVAAMKEMESAMAKLESIGLFAREKTK